MTTLQEEAEYFRNEQKKYDVSEQEISALVAETPDFTKYEITKAFLKANRRCFISTCDEINKLAGDNKDEIARIQSAFWMTRSMKAMYNEIQVDEGIKEFMRSFHDKKEPTLEDIMLSTAFISCKGSLLEFKNGDMLEAIENMALSSEMLGMYIGRKDCHDLHDGIKKKIQERASRIRHTPSRAVKTEIIQEYEDNYVPRLKGLGVREASKIKNKAAEELANKYEVEYRTVRNDYIDQYHRENTPS